MRYQLVNSTSGFVCYESNSLPAAIEAKVDMEEITEQEHKIVDLNSMQGACGMCGYQNCACHLEGESDRD